MIGFRVEIPGIPKSPNESRRTHWARNSVDAAGFRRAAKIAARVELRRRGIPPKEIPITPAAVHLTFVLVRAQGDLDNLVAAAKPIIDGLVDSGVLGGDGVLRLPLLTAGWRRGPEKAVVVEITKVET